MLEHHYLLRFCEVTFRKHHYLLCFRRVPMRKPHYLLHFLMIFSCDFDPMTRETWISKRPESTSLYHSIFVNSNGDCVQRAGESCTQARVVFGPRSNDQQQPATTSHDQRPATISNNQQQPGTTSNDQQRLATTGNDQQRPARPATTSNDQWSIDKKSS